MAPDVFQLLGMRVFKIPKITRGQRALQSCYISRCWRTEAGFWGSFLHKPISADPPTLTVYLNAAKSPEGPLDAAHCRQHQENLLVTKHSGEWWVKGRLSPAGWETRTQEGGRMAAGCGQPFSAPIQRKLGMRYSEGQLPLLSLACEIPNIPEPLFRFTNSQKIPVLFSVTHNSLPNTTAI